MLPNLPIKKLRSAGEEAGDPTSTTLRELCAGKVGVIDLWHTNCTKCPAALSKLNELAPGFPADKVIVVACALSLGSDNLEAVSEYIDEWQDLHHVFVEESEKEALKAQLGYSAVPFYIVFDQAGNIVNSGDSRAVDCKEEIEKLTSGSKLAFDDDF